MNNKKRTLALLACILVTVLVCVMAFSVSAGASVITDAELTEGRAFVDGEGIQIGKDLTEMPRTYEAVVYVPSNVTERGAILSNNYAIGGACRIDFQIGMGGSGTPKQARPMLDITDQNNNRTRVEFVTNVRAEAWMHVVITHQKNDSGDIYTCYVNGEKVTGQNINYWENGTKNSEANLTHDLDMKAMQQQASMYVGQAYGYSSTTELGANDPYNEGESYIPTNFKGRIKDIALYSEALTEAEIKANYNSGINAEHENIMLCYDFTKEEVKPGYIEDVSGNGYDTIPLYHERTEALNPEDYDYSFAVLGDTQFLVDWDLKNGTSYTQDIYNWIIANKDSKKIARVLGVGDIVESGRLDAGVTDESARAHAVAQWEYAVEQFAKLEAAGIPYTITWGYNHDGYEGEEFTTYFGNSTNFTNSNIGYYFNDPESADYNKRLANYYQCFEVAGVKYMVMCIEYRPDEAVLNWADAVIKANTDRRVIINTHYFLDQHGNISQEYEEIQPKWDKLANENKNVEMILCGHVARQNNIVRAYTVAKSGQTVAQFLIDPQQMDRFYGYDDTGVVAMLYFSDGGDDVRVEFISTSRTMRAKENNPDAEDVLYGRKNEFKLEYSTGGEKKPAGSSGEIDVYIIAGQSNAVGYGRGELTVDDPRFKTGFENVLYYGDHEYYGEYDIKGLIPVKLELGQGTYRSGAETGIAYKLNDNGRMTVIIKCAQGATPLYPIEGNSTLEKYGSWTSPSFMEKYPELVYHEKVGGMYERLISTLTSGSAKLEAEGYTPVVKGIWWMQGEADTGKELAANAYEELLTDLITDLRGDLTEIFTQDCSATPFVMGEITSNHITAPAYLNTVLAAQAAVAESVDNVSIVDTTGLEQQDSWHFTAESQRIIGERFVDAVKTVNGGYVTEYGEIPAGAYDPVNKPFALFYGGAYVDSFADWYRKDTDGVMHGVIPYIQTTLGFKGIASNAKEAQIVLLRDCTAGVYDNAAQLGGTIVIDLNGFTLRASDSGQMFSGKAKYNCDTTVKFKNGNIVLGKKHISQFVCNGSYESKKYDYTFENVNFSFATGDLNQLTVGVGTDANTASLSMTVNLTFNGCTFDLVTNAKSGATMFSLKSGSTTGAVKGTVKINGGKIIANDASAVSKLYSVDSNDTVTYGKYDGKYTELQVPTGASVLTTNFKAHDGYTGNLRFAKTATLESADLYELSEITTKYGDIPVDYLSPEQYPFILFVYNGDELESVVGYEEYLGASTNKGVYGYAAAALKTNTFEDGGLGQKSAVILQRRDYTAAAGEIYWNFAQIRGVVTHDLGGYTLSQSSENGAKHLLMLQCKPWNDYDVNEIAPTHIYFTNGNMVTYSAPIMELRCSASTNANYTISDKDFTVKFSNVKFSLGEGATTSTLMTTYNGNVAAKDQDPNPMANFDIVFEDCDIDLFYNVTSKSFTLFNLSPTAKNGVSVDIKFYGGTLRGREWDGDGSGENIKVWRSDATNGSTFCFEKSKTTGEYFTLHMTPSAATPSADNVYVNSKGNELGFGVVSSTGNIKVFTLLESESTKYGNIPFNAGSAKDYPFALFVYPAGSDKATYVGVYKMLLGADDNYAFNVAKNQIQDNEWNGSYSGQARAVILMRNDYTMGASEQFYNFAQIRGEITLDLGGFTLSQDSSSSAKALFAITTKPWGNNGTSDGHADVFPSVINIENGTILTYNGPVFNLGYNSTTESPESLSNKLFTINVSGVTFGLKDGATASSLMFAYNNGKTAGSDEHDKDIAPFFFNFTDCVFDLDTVKPAGNMLVFDIDSSSNYLKNTVKVYGCEIKADGASIVNSGTNDSTLTFVKHQGSYVILTGLSVPTDVLNTAENYKAVFGNVGGVYTLVPAEAKIIGAHLNITENINVCYTVVAPIGSESVYMVFEFNGKTYTVTEYEEKDGKLVFKFLGVVPQKLGDNIKATLYATKDGETESNVVENYSVKTYCVNMLARTDDAKLKTLLSDLLVYGAKSQLYTGYNVENLVTDGVEGLTPSAYTDVTKTDAGINGEKNESVSWVGAALRYENEMAMKLVFKADAALVLKVSVNGRTVEFTADDFVTDENGNSVVYFRGIMATEYDEVVTAAFYNGETQVGESITYSVNSYVYSKQAVTDAALAELVKATYNYGVSADNYAG